MTAPNDGSTGAGDDVPGGKDMSPKEVTVCGSTGGSGSNEVSRSRPGSASSSERASGSSSSSESDD
jgi:hypothetical protein